VNRTPESGARDVAQGFSPADNVRADVDAVCEQALISGWLDAARNLGPEAPRRAAARLEPPVSSHDEGARR
jgi:hypothetical protein